MLSKGTAAEFGHSYCGNGKCLNSNWPEANEQPTRQVADEIEDTYGQIFFCRFALRFVFQSLLLNAPDFKTTACEERTYP